MSRKKKTSAQRAHRLRKIGKRLAAYSAAAAATAVASQDRSADAKQILHDIPDVTVGSNPGLLFNMVNGTATFATSTYYNSNPGSMRLIGNYTDAAGLRPYAYMYTPASSAMGAFVGFISNDFAYASGLGFGVSVDGNNNFVADPGYVNSWGNYAYLPLSQFPANTNGYVGFRFDLAGSTHYGWAEISLRPRQNKATLHSFGYNDVAGEAAITGVPEPSSMMLLAAGAAGLAGWRRRRAGKAA